MSTIRKTCKEIHGKLLKKAEKEARRQLKKEGFQDKAITEAFEELKARDFVRLVCVLASDPALGKIAREKFAAALAAQVGGGVRKQDLVPVVDAIADRDASKLRDLLSSDSLRKALIDAAAKKYGVNAKEAELAIELLRNGVLREDMIGVTRLTIVLLRATPCWLPAMIKKPTNLLKVLQGLAKDLFVDPKGKSVKIIEAFKTGNLPDLASLEDIHFLDDTLRAVCLALPAVDDTMTWAAGVLDKESVQVAIVLYANAKGLPITRQHVKAVQQALAARDLGPLIPSLVTLAKKEGLGGLKSPV